jgi:hypothetical protein
VTSPDRTSTERTLTEAFRQAQREGHDSLASFSLELKEQLRLHPEWAEGWQLLGDTYAEIGDGNQALDAYEQWYALTHDNPKNQAYRRTAHGSHKRYANSQGKYNWGKEVEARHGPATPSINRPQSPDAPPKATEFPRRAGESILRLGRVQSEDKCSLWYTDPSLPGMESADVHDDPQNADTLRRQQELIRNHVVRGDCPCVAALTSKELRDSVEAYLDIEWSEQSRNKIEQEHTFIKNSVRSVLYGEPVPIRLFERVFTDLGATVDEAHRWNSTRGRVRLPLQRMYRLVHVLTNPDNRADPRFGDQRIVLRYHLFNAQIDLEGDGIYELPRLPASDIEAEGALDQGSSPALLQDVFAWARHVEQGMSMQVTFNVTQNRANQMKLGHPAMQRVVSFIFSVDTTK